MEGAYAGKNLHHDDVAVRCKTTSTVLFCQYKKIVEGDGERGGESTFASFDLVSQLEPHVRLAILQPLRSITAQCDNVESGSGLLRMCARH